MEGVVKYLDARSAMQGDSKTRVFESQKTWQK